MTAVTGKFVLKCRTTNIATLFDISLFYVYKFYFIYFSQVQHRTAIPRVGVALSTILKTIKEFAGTAAAIGTKPFLYSKASTEMVILKDLFQTV